MLLLKYPVCDIKNLKFIKEQEASRLSKFSLVGLPLF